MGSNYVGLFPITVGNQMENHVGHKMEAGGIEGCKELLLKSPFSGKPMTDYISIPKP